MDSASEIMLAQILPLSYNDTMNWCKTSKRNSDFCKKDYVWQQKAKYNFGYELDDSKDDVVVIYKREDHARETYKLFKQLVNTGEQDDLEHAITLFNTQLFSFVSNYRRNIFLHIIDKNLDENQTNAIFDSLMLVLEIYQNADDDAEEHMLFSSEKTNKQLADLISIIWRRLSGAQCVFLIPIVCKLKSSLFSKGFFNSVELFLIRIGVRSSYGINESQRLLKRLISHANLMNP